MGRFRHLGLQKRIMLYVVVGLAVMFGAVAVLGLDAIDEATRLVYRERLSTAHTTAGILERDFARVAAAIETAKAELFPGSESSVPAGTATRLLARFQRTPDEYPYFAISGVWILDGAGRVLDEAGTPDVQPAGTQVVSAWITNTHEGRLAVFPAVAWAGGGQPFAALAFRIASSPPTLGPIVVVHTVSLSRSEPFVPADHGEPEAPGERRPTTGISDEYHLEVVGPDGITLLGVGADEHPGQPSPHFVAIRDLIATGSPATLVHDPGGRWG